VFNLDNVFKPSEPAVFAKSGPQNSINTTTLGLPEFGFLTTAKDPARSSLR